MSYVLKNQHLEHGSMTYSQIGQVFGFMASYLYNLDEYEY